MKGLVLFDEICVGVYTWILGFFVYRVLGVSLTTCLNGMYGFSVSIQINLMIMIACYSFYSDLTPFNVSCHSLLMVKERFST